MGHKRHPLLLLLMAALMMVSFASATAEAKDFVVVLDAGHGGNDIGAPGEKSKEKDINRKVTDKLAKLIKDKIKHVKVIQTRSRDNYVSLRDRCRIANNEGADLFVSIHCDASNSNPSAYGSTVFIPFHKRNLSTVTSKRSSGMIECEESDTLSPVYLDKNDPDVEYMVSESARFARLVSNELTNTAGRDMRGVKKRDLFVLEFSSMPAVLIELDFICNPEREEFLNSDEGQDKLALAICNALKKYVKNLTPKPKKSSKPSKNVTAPAVPQKKKGAHKTRHSHTEPAAKGDQPKKGSDAKAQSSEVIYKIQFLTSGRKLNPSSANMKSLSPVEYYIENNTYKYTYGSTTSISEANKMLKKVRELFPDAFIITTRDGARVK